MRSLKEVERDQIILALVESECNIRDAAKKLATSTRTLQRMLAKTKYFHHLQRICISVVYK